MSRNASIFIFILIKLVFIKQQFDIMHSWETYFYSLISRFFFSCLSNSTFYVTWNFKKQLGWTFLLLLDGTENLVI